MGWGKENPVTAEIYVRIVDAWEAAKPNFTEAGKLAGVDARTVKRAYLKGWPRKGFPALITKDEQKLEQRREQEREQIAAREREKLERERRDKEDAEEREKARAAQALSRQQEGQIVALARGSALTALQIAGQLIVGGRELSAHLRGELVKLAQNPAGMNVKDGVDLLNRVVDLLGKVNQCAHEAMRMERLYLGTPQAILMLQGESHEDMPMEEAKARVASLSQVIQMAEDAGCADAQPSASEPSVGTRVVVH